MHKLQIKLFIQTGPKSVRLRKINVSCKLVNIKEKPHAFRHQFKKSNDNLRYMVW